MLHYRTVWLVKHEGNTCDKPGFKLNGESISYANFNLFKKVMYNLSTGY